VPRSKRVEALFDPEHYRIIEQLAKTQGKTVGALVLVDTNIFIHALGSSHLYKAPCRLLLARMAETSQGYNIDVEMLKEIMHVYNSRGGRAFGFAIFDTLPDLFHDSFPISRSEMVLARRISESYPGLSLRDAIHAAVVTDQDLEGIVTTETSFSQVRGLTVFDPSELAAEPIV
jgi:predicted nucleic acid-binding protein